MDKILFYKKSHTHTHTSRERKPETNNIWTKAKIKNVTKNECYLNRLKTIRKLPVPINN